MEREKNDIDANLSLKLFVVMTRALEAIKARAQENIKGLGLNPTDFGVLEFIYNKGEQPIQKIGKKVLISSSSITYVVDKLEGKNLLIRKPCPQDRRITYAQLTDEGKQLMNDIFPKHKRAIQNICSGLNINEKREMISNLKKLGFYAQNE